MGKLKAIGITGLALLLAGVLASKGDCQDKKNSRGFIIPTEDVAETCIMGYCTHANSKFNKSNALIEISQIKSNGVEERFEKNLLFYLANMPDSSIKYSTVLKTDAPVEKMLLYTLKGLSFEKSGNLKKARDFYKEADKERKKAKFFKLIGGEEAIFSPNYFLGKSYFSGDKRDIRKGLKIWEKEYFQSERDIGNYSSALLKLSGEISGLYFELGNFEQGEKWLFERSKYLK